MTTKIELTTLVRTFINEFHQRLEQVLEYCATGTDMCVNDQCECLDCTCGAYCPCKPNVTKVCNPCKEFCRKNSSSTIQNSPGWKKKLMKRRELFKFFEERRQQLVRILVITKWLKDSNDSGTLETMHMFFERHEKHLLEVKDRLWESQWIITRFLFQGLWDFQSAIHVLSSGSYRLLPLCIQNAVPVVTPVPVLRESSIISRLNTYIRSRVLANPPPPLFTGVKIAQGTLSITVKNIFEAILSLRMDRNGMFTWLLLRLRWFVSIPVPGDPHRSMPLINAAASDELIRNVNVQIFGLNQPFPRLYNILVGFASHLALDVLRAQSQEHLPSLKSDLGPLEVEVLPSPAPLPPASSDSIDPAGSEWGRKRRELRLKYWKDLGELHPQADLLRFVALSDPTSAPRLQQPAGDNCTSSIRARVLARPRVQLRPGGSGVNSIYIAIAADPYSLRLRVHSWPADPAAPAVVSAGGNSHWAEDEKIDSELDYSRLDIAPVLLRHAVRRANARLRWLQHWLTRLSALFDSCALELLAEAGSTAGQARIDSAPAKGLLALVVRVRGPYALRFSVDLSKGTLQVTNWNQMPPSMMTAVARALQLPTPALSEPCQNPGIMLLPANFSLRQPGGCEVNPLPGATAFLGRLLGEVRMRGLLHALARMLSALSPPLLASPTPPLVWPVTRQQNQGRFNLNLPHKLSGPCALYLHLDVCAWLCVEFVQADQRLRLLLVWAETKFSLGVVKGACELRPANAKAIGQGLLLQELLKVCKRAGAIGVAPVPWPGSETEINGGWEALLMHGSHSVCACGDGQSLWCAEAWARLRVELNQGWPGLLAHQRLSKHISRPIELLPEGDLLLEFEQKQTKIKTVRLRVAPSQQGGRADYILQATIELRSEVKLESPTSRFSAPLHSTRAVSPYFTTASLPGPAARLARARALSTAPTPALPLESALRGEASFEGRGASLGTRAGGQTGAVRVGAELVGGNALRFTLRGSVSAGLALLIDELKLVNKSCELNDGPLGPLLRQLVGLQREGALAVAASWQGGLLLVSPRVRQQVVELKIDHANSELVSFRALNARTATSGLGSEAKHPIAELTTILRNHLSRPPAKFFND